MTIKEVEQYLEVPRATVRFYEKEGLIRPERGGNGYRDYSEEDVERLRKIIIFRKLGMALTDIEDVLDGAKPLSQAVEENIVNLEKQIEELKGALFVCHKLQEEKEEMETFEVEKYWNVIAEEEKKGNRFLDIAKDMVRFEKMVFRSILILQMRRGIWRSVYLWRFWQCWEWL
ncbi:MAG: MerR family transcriptional regulator [Lachnospiraceae bacterium]|nr:MerR family transcriptional regulator [Lachnospiraceae bacterium]